MPLAVALAGCGGSGGGASRILHGDGYRFRAPASWSVKRTPQSVEAKKGNDAVSVTVFRLVRPYRPALWPKVVPELDRVAADLAAQLKGSVGAGATVVVAGRRARRYDIRHTGLVDRITFVLDRRREYQLLCRYRDGRAEPACAALASSFALG